MQIRPPHLNKSCTQRGPLKPRGCTRGGGLRCYGDDHAHMDMRKQQAFSAGTGFVENLAVGLQPAAPRTDDFLARLQEAEERDAHSQALIAGTSAIQENAMLAHARHLRRQCRDCGLCGLCAFPRPDGNSHALGWSGEPIAARQHGQVPRVVPSTEQGLPSQALQRPSPPAAPASAHGDKPNRTSKRGNAGKPLAKSSKTGK